MAHWAIDLGTTNTRISRWNELLNQPEIVKIESLCRKNSVNYCRDMEMPSVIPSSVLILPHDNFLTKLGLIPFVARRFFIGRQGVIGQKAIDENLDMKKSNFVSGFKQHRTIWFLRLL